MRDCDFLQLERRMVERISKVERSFEEKCETVRALGEDLARYREEVNAKLDRIMGEYKCEIAESRTEANGAWVDANRLQSERDRLMAVVRHVGCLSVGRGECTEFGDCPEFVAGCCNLRIDYPERT